MISVITDPEKVRKILEGVTKAWRSRAVSASGGDQSSRALGRSPPAAVGARIPMPPLQGRLDSGEWSAAVE
ncbi:MAG: hypothetical protein ACJA2W_004118 [Planctomycetota bacterium]|jgi:hypothetical protein